MASRSLKPLLKPDFEEKVLLLLGPSGAGKSTAGNFIAEEEHFPIRGSSLTEQTTLHKFEYDGTKVHLIDTVGFDEMSRSDKEVLKEFTAAVLMAADAGGIHQFLICVDANSESLPLFSSDVLSALIDLDGMRAIWPYATLLFTKAGKCGYTECQRGSEIDRLITTRCSYKLTWLVKKLGKQRRLIIESDDLRRESAFEIRFMMFRHMIELATVSVREGGVYINVMMQDAKQCWDEYKLSIEKKRKHTTDAHPPSYADLASEIIDNIIVPPGRERPFSQICRGIQEFQRKRQESYSSTEAQQYTGCADKN